MLDERGIASSPTSYVERRRGEARSSPTTSARSLRPAGHGAGQHGSRLRRPQRARRRAQLRAGRQAHVPVRRSTTTSSPSATPPTSPRPRPARSPTSPSTCSSRTSSPRRAGDAARFDGHANCFVESGDGKAMLIDFNYDTEPLPGKYPCPGWARSRCSRRPGQPLGKLAFKWIYWNILLPGRRCPCPR
jgi:hypothetical protein